MRNIAIGVLALGIASCGMKKDDFPGQSQDDSPGISFQSPDDGAEILSSSVWIDLKVSNFTLNPSAMGSAAVEGEGHFHVYVDGAAAGEGATERWLVTDLEPGEHEISVRLFGNDHQPVAGVHPTSTHIVIPEESPRVSIVSPSAGATVRASSVELTISTANYPSGRWQAYVDSLDGEVAGIGEDPTNIVSRIPAGSHVVYVRLHHSDGTPYEPQVIDTIPVEIPADAPRLQIVSPAPGSTTDRFPVLTVQAENFDIDGNSAGGAPEDGEGHFHIYVGGYDSGHMWQEGFANEVTLNNIPPGERDIYVRLMNNDHTSIEPKIVDRIRITVQ